MKTNPGPAIRSTDSVIRNLQEEHHLLISGVTEQNKTKFKEHICDAYCDTLVQHLEKRFPDLPLVRSLQLFDPQLIPSTEAVELYGNDFVTELSQYYHVDTCMAQQEWESVCLLLQTQEFKDKSATHILTTLSSNETLLALYPILSRFAQVALTLSVSNADVERGFSCMNRVKTELRNRLTVSSLDNLLRISTEGPDKDFDFGAAVAKWSSMRNRRIF